MIIPDYSLEVVDVYTNFAKEWLVVWNDAKLLSYGAIFHLQMQPPTGICLHLPSWVPDWSQASSNIIDGLAPARCAGRSSAFWKLDENENENGNRNRLSVQGLLVGRLTYVSPPSSVSTTIAELRELCRSWM